MSYCDDCILLDICGKEGCLDDAMTFCGDKDEFIPKSVIEDIKSEIEAIEMEGMIDDRTRFIRGGEEVRHLVLEIISKHISGKETE